VDEESSKMILTVDFAKSFGKKVPVKVILSDPIRFKSWLGVKVEIVHDTASVDNPEVGIYPRAA